jgi:hypothetical protein
MAEERVTVLRFSGDEDEYSVWYLQARDMQQDLDF